jgi:hypothetical protein
MSNYTFYTFVIYCSALVVNSFWAMLAAVGISFGLIVVLKSGEEFVDD